jgi:hypothetical protein
MSIDDTIFWDSIATMLRVWHGRAGGGAAASFYKNAAFSNK